LLQPALFRQHSKKKIAAEREHVLMEASGGIQSNLFE
jgi:hypothetical protein